jgi:hypothetical protein
MQSIDLTGHTYHRWTVIEPAPQKGRYTQWFCRCVCGTLRAVRTCNLRSGASLSCGCLQREVAGSHLVKHRMANKPEYPEFHIWNSMKQRCINPHNTRYTCYGGRGITVCQAWRESFETFYADMGPRPGPEYSIERRDNDGPYAPENCYWATIDIQSRNKRSNHYVTLYGRRACLAEWFEIIGIRPMTYFMRIRYGWSVEQALTTPVPSSRPKYS